MTFFKYSCILFLKYSWILFFEHPWNILQYYSWNNILEIFLNNYDSWNNIFDIFLIIILEIFFNIILGITSLEFSWLAEYSKNIQNPKRNIPQKPCAVQVICLLSLFFFNVRRVRRWATGAPRRDVAAIPLKWSVVCSQNFFWGPQQSENFETQKWTTFTRRWCMGSTL